MAGTKADVKSLAGRSGKQWDAVVGKAIAPLIGGVIGYLLMKIGLA